MCLLLYCHPNQQALSLVRTSALAQSQGELSTQVKLCEVMFGCAKQTNLYTSTSTQQECLSNVSGAPVKWQESRNSDFQLILIEKVTSKFLHQVPKTRPFSYKHLNHVLCRPARKTSKKDSSEYDSDIQTTNISF